MFVIIKLNLMHTYLHCQLFDIKMSLQTINCRFIINNLPTFMITDIQIYISKQCSMYTNGPMFIKQELVSFLQEVPTKN